MAPVVKKRLGQMLVDEGKITDSQLQDALTIHRSSGKKLGKVLIETGMVDEEDMLNVLRMQLSIDLIDLSTEPIEGDAVDALSETIARKYTLIPVRMTQSTIVVALSDPLNIFALEDVSIYTGKQVKSVLAKESDIIRKQDIFYSKKEAMRVADNFAKETQSLSRVVEEVNDDDDENSAPIIKIVNSIMEQAVMAKASDIHIEPYEGIIRVRFRVDGILQESMTFKKNILPPLVARVKILSNLDISERRIPQDGRMNYTYFNDEFEMRVSTLPTVFGEKIVIRVQNKAGFLKNKSEIGFTKRDLEAFNKIIGSSNGIILVSGPTGSGKTTTLYTILSELNRIGTNIITVEDPVESKMHGINQVQVHHKAGLNFASALRSILRQDPDIIMLGEIRDGETAEIAVRSAITGHLVLSTIHTNDSPTTVSRLNDMGVENFLIGSSLVGVISQRLVRTICRNCRESYTPDDIEVKAMKIDSTKGYTLYKGRGCKECNNTGYKGRTGIYEIMLVNGPIKRAIFAGKTSKDIEEIALEQGMVTLSQSCVEKVLGGETTYEEYMRVTYSI
ncbi:MAG: GspE/PulE family protein [Clostridium sp.]